MELKSARVPITSMLSRANDAKPVFEILGEVNQYANKLKLNYEASVDKKEENVIIALLQSIYEHAYQSAMVNDLKRHEFDVDIDLHNERNKYFDLDRQAESHYQAELAKYNVSVANISAGIDEAMQDLAMVNKTKKVDELQGLGLYARIQRDIETGLANLEDNFSQIGCFPYLFCHVPDKIKRARNMMGELQNRRAQLNSGDVNVVRKLLVNHIDAEMKVKREELEVLVANPPRRDDQYEQMYINIEARISADEREYYSCVNHAVMLDMLKLHFMINKLHKLLVNPRDREMTEQLKQSFLTLTAGLYCEEPGRYYFQYYLKRMRAIKDNNVINDVMFGYATEEQVRLVIPQYGEPVFQNDFSLTLALSRNSPP